MIFRGIEGYVPILEEFSPRADFGIIKYPAAMLGYEITLNADGEFDKD
jgi:hypothetical protein